MLLETLNLVTPKEAELLFLQCCSASNWASKMTNARPFSVHDDLSTTADEVWNTLSTADYLEAFEGHPKIGDIDSLREKYAHTKAMAGVEQSAMDDASEKTLSDLSVANDEYYAKFGFIFIVCATGKTAEEMLTILQLRCANDKATELDNAAEEQRKIFHIRIDRLIGA